MADIKLSEICVRFDTKTLFKRLNLEVRDGEYLVVLGQSGTGKSTLLHLIAGLQSPTSGQIWLDQRDITAESARKRGVALVFQNDALYPHMSVGQMLRFGLPTVGKEAATDHRIAAAIDATRIGQLLGRRPANLSGGEKKRVALAKTLAKGAKVRLLDEPLSAIDAPHRQELINDLRSIHHAAGGTTLHVTHDASEAMQLATRIAVLGEGGVVQTDAPAAMYVRPVDLAVCRLLATTPINVFSSDDVPARSDATVPGRVAVVRSERIGLSQANQACQGALLRDGDSICLAGEVVRLAFVPPAWRVSVVAGKHEVTVLLTGCDDAKRVPEIGQSVTAKFFASDILWLPEKSATLHRNV